MENQPRPAPTVTIRRLLQLARPEARRIAVAIVFLFISSAASLAFPQAIRLIVDEALGAKDMGFIDRAALVLLGLFMLQGTATALRSYLFATAGERVVTQLREDLFRTIMNQEVAFFDERRTGELISRLGSDTTVLQNTVTTNISMVLRNTAQMIGGICLLIYTSPTLTALMLVVVPPVAIGAVAYGRRVRKLSREVQDALAQSSQVAEERISSLRTVRAFAAEQSEVARYRDAVMKSFELARKRILATSTFMGGASFAAFGAGAVVFWYGGRLLMSGQMTAGALITFLIYTMTVAFSLGAVSDLWADFMKASGASERIFEIIDRQPSMPVTGGAVIEQLQGTVEFQGVHFTYPSRKDIPVLKGLDLTLRAGEVIALVGPSGGGKSTVASLLTRLYDPADGRILLDGRDLRELDPSWLRQQIGTVAQEPTLFSNSIAENIRYGRAGATDAEVEAAARTANAHEFISRFPEGYRTLVGERGIQLSGGQKQRVAIARALLKDPRILILDEATSALDAESEHLVKEALDRLMKGRTTLIIAHRLSTVADADRVLVLDGGQVVQSGKHAALAGEEGLYKRLVERQFVAA